MERCRSVEEFLPPLAGLVFKFRPFRERLRGFETKTPVSAPIVLGQPQDSPNLPKAAIDRMKPRLRGPVSGADEEASAVAGLGRGVELRCDVREEEDLAGGQGEGGGDGGVGGGVLLGAGPGVMEALEIRGEVAMVGVPEEELLRVYAAGREDAQPAALVPPGLQRGRDVRIDVAADLALRVPLVPDQPLEELEAGRLAVTLHQPAGIRRAIAEGGWRIGRGLLGVLGAQLGERLPQLGAARVG